MMDKTTTTKVPTTLGDRIRTRREALGLSQLALARQAGLKQPTISSLELDQAKTSRNIASIAHALHVSALWLQTGEGDPKVMMTGTRQIANPVRREEGTILIPVDYLESRGSCGGGARGQRDVDEIAASKAPFVLSSDLEAQGIEDPSVIKALIADGDAMANFIVHGDLVLINTSDNERLLSNEIYAFETGAGLTLRRVLLRANGNVLLTADNPDKHHFPDEDYTAEEAATLQTIGRFFQRKG
jgi:phage repressor protein C with HTH and peptisase S24 domain